MNGRPSLRWVVVVPAVVIACTLVGLNLLLERALRNEIEASTEIANQTFTRVFVNEEWETLRPLLGIDGGSSDPRGNRYLREIDARVRGFARGTDLVKVKIYDPRGLTVYSSDPAQIGEDKANNPGFLTAARGRTVSELTFRGKFGSFDGELYQRNLVSSYVPVRSPSGVEAVVETYTDRTESIESIKRGQRALMVWSVPVAVALYAAFIAFAWSWRRRCAMEGAKGAGAPSGARQDPAPREPIDQASAALMAGLARELSPPIDALEAALARPSGGAPDTDAALAAAQSLRRRARWLELLGRRDGDAGPGPTGVDADERVRAALEAVSPRAKAKGLDLQAHFGVQPAEPVVGSPDEVGAILESVLSDAIDTTATGFVHLRLNPSPDGLQFDVVDTRGPGDAASGSSEASDFRLALTEALVVRLGGLFSSREALPAGRWVTFSLPFVAAAGRAAPPGASGS